MMYLFIKSYEEFWDLGFIRNNKRQLSATIDSLNEIQVLKPYYSSLEQPVSNLRI